MRKIKNLLCSLLCKNEEEIVYKAGRAEFIYYDKGTTATRVLNWIERFAPSERDKYFYGEEQGTIAINQNGRKVILPFGIYFIAIDGEIFLLDKKIFEGIVNVDV